VSKIIPFFRGIEGLPVNEVLTKGWSMIRALDDNLHGLADVKSMVGLDGYAGFSVSHDESGLTVKPITQSEMYLTPDELRDRWSRMNMHEGGIEWDGPLPNWTPGLKVTEEE
jgi:hypothetical protein